MTFPGVTNPTAIGSYGVTVKTNVETTAVASNTITTTNPTLPPVSGIAPFITARALRCPKPISSPPALASVSLFRRKKLPNRWYLRRRFWYHFYQLDNPGVVGSASTVILVSSAPWTLSGATVVVDSRDHR